MSETPPTYQELVSALAESKPRVARALRVADTRRSERLAGYLDGMRLRGLEQLHTYLDAAAESYASIPAIADLTFLVERVRADFETALEATLSGYQGVASDAMRDVMEIEGLLLDFGANRGNAEEWLRSDHRLRMRKYAPPKVRERLMASGVPPYSNEGFEPVDYAAHSESLHVNPASWRPPGPEPADEPVPFYADFGFMEMFEHGNRVWRAIELLRVVALGTLGEDEWTPPPGDYQPLTPRDDFDDAYAHTSQMQVISLALFEGPAILHDRLGREPKTSEVLGYVADELKLKRPRANQD